MRRKEEICEFVVTKLPISLEPSESLLKRAKKFQAEQARLACRILAQDSCGYRGRLIGDETGRTSRRSGDSQLDGLIGAKEVFGSDAGSEGADIKGLSEFNEI